MEPIKNLMGKGIWTFSYPTEDLVYEFKIHESDIIYKNTFKAKGRKLELSSGRKEELWIIFHRHLDGIHMISPINDKLFEEIKFDKNGRNRILSNVVFFFYK